MPSVSIIIRTEGQRGDAFRQALGTAVSQTWRPLDVVVVEDGGDRLAATVAGFPRPHDVPRHHLPMPKRGRSAAGNAGMKAANGDLACFLDDDDWLEPHHAACLAEAHRLASDAVATYSLANEIAVDRRQRPVRRRVVGRIPLPRERLWLGNVLPIQAVLFRRDSFDRAGGLDEGLEALEDWDLWLRLSALGRFVGVDAVTSSFRVPAGRCELKRRAEQHAAVLGHVVAKNGSLAAQVTLKEIMALEADFRGRLDDVVGARWCLARLWRRLRTGR